MGSFRVFLLLLLLLEDKLLVLFFGVCNALVQHGEVHQLPELLQDGQDVMDIDLGDVIWGGPRGRTGGK